MRLILSAMFLAASIGSCSALEPPVKEGGCNTRASVSWTQAGKGYVADAFSDGPSCELAVVTLVVRAPDGKPMWTQSSPASHLMVFGGVDNTAKMNSALGEWVNQEKAMMPTGEKLPAWDADQETPTSGEFPFYLEEGVDREFYEKVRRADAPLFCYVQGMESMACVTLDKETNEMTKVGVQTFPG